MKITALETFFVKPRWMFLKISTDEGLTGWGEPIVEGRARTVAMAVEEAKPTLIGQDPLKIEYLWQLLYRGTFYRGGPVLTSALSGIDQALWDIKGKYHGVPVSELLGGPVRERVRMYAGCGGGTPEECAERAAARIAEGFTGLKMGVDGPVRIVDTPAYVRGQADKLAAVRAAVGPGIDIGIDFHGRISPAMAALLARAYEPYSPMFIEEPCLPENVEALATIARGTCIPVATGERLFTRWGFRPVLEKQAAAILQPDLCHCGGISEGRRIAAMAEAYYCAVAPHNPLGPISLASCIQLDLATPNFLIQEFPYSVEGLERGERYLKKPFEVVGGYIQKPEGAGLCIEVDEQAVAELSYDGAWDTPHEFHRDDGSFAEW